MAENQPRARTAIAIVTVAVLAVLVAGLWAFVFVKHGQAGSGDVAAASTKAQPSASPSSSSSSPTQAEGEWTMDDAREAFASEGSRTLVLGDSTGNGFDEWVHVWADSQELPAATWQTDTESGYSGETEETRVWSGAMFEATAGYPAEHWQEIWPAQDPDLVLLSYGHFHESAQGATEALEELRADIAERAPEAPIVVVLQNPQADDANAEVRQAIAEWAESAGLPTIDIAQAFEESGTLAANLRLDTFNPSAAGSQLWAETVAEALAG